MIWPKNTRGFVSLLTCVIISMLLLVITISLTTVENIQLSQSVNSEQSLRSYYTAEAGVEDAVSKILDGNITFSPGGTGCVANTAYSSPVTGDPNQNAGWTCQQVTFTGAPTGRLTAPDQAVTIMVGKTTPAYSSIVLEWDQSQDPHPLDFPVNLSAGFPTQTFYNGNYAAAPLEMAIVQYPDTPFSSNQICNGISLGNPGGCTVSLENAVFAPGGTGVPGNITYSRGTGFTNHGPIIGNCSDRVATGTAGYHGSTGYNCYAIINGLNTGDDYLFRLRSLYKASSYRMTFYTQNNGNGVPVKVPTGMALIDVTAKSGVSYRRVIYNMPLFKGAAAGLNYVMYSDTDICKNFSVINNVAQSGCPY